MREVALGLCEVRIKVVVVLLLLLLLMTTTMQAEMQRKATDGH